MADFQTVVQQGVRMYEREEQQLHLLLFDETLHHIVRLDRLLSEPGGSVLLVGRTGVGRRNATALVAHMHGVRFYSPSITREYGMRQFFVDVKQVLQVAGVEGADVCLYLEDYQFTEGSILETVNSLLSSGEVPGLYTHEELEPLLAPLKEEMGEEGFQCVAKGWCLVVHTVVPVLHVVVVVVSVMVYGSACGEERSCFADAAPCVCVCCCWCWCLPGVIAGTRRRTTSSSRECDATCT